MTMLKRSMFQLYVNNCDDAIKFYEKAFNTKLETIYRSEEDSSIIHSEMNFMGQCIALSEKKSQSITGNTMQICFHFNESNENEIQKIYDILKEDAEIISPLGECFYSSFMTDLIDKYGVRWCLFI